MIMTREEATQHARYVRELSKDCSIIALDADVIDALLSNPWHKTSEELPKNGGHYLCMDENKHIVQLAFCGTKWVNTSQFIDIDLYLVKYWIPIPELPKED